MTDRPISERLAFRLCPPGGRTSCSTPCELCMREARAICDELASWLDQRFGGSSETADLIRAIYP